MYYPYKKCGLKTVYILCVYIVINRILSLYIQNIKVKLVKPVSLEFLGCFLENFQKMT